MPATPINIAVTIAEAVLILAGVVLLARIARGWKTQPAALPAWDATVSDFLLFAFLIVAGGLLGGFVCGLIVNRFSLPPDTKTILNSAGFQLGLLIGPALLPLSLPHHPVFPPLRRNVLVSGAVTFLIALPIVTVVNLGWQAVMDFFGIPAEQQDLLRMFTQATEPTLVTTMVILAVIIAPVTEELLFRATLFRYLRTRSPRWIALLLPGTIFASLHVNWGSSTYEGLASLVPLITLAVIFSIAYERTGHIATAMIAHALFNLHTIALLLSGVSS
ncbi:MAG: type II CAAX endopeptidase family protein [Opitutus sp.]